jgi:hypothetical protein
LYAPFVRQAVDGARTLKPERSRVPKKSHGPVMVALSLLKLTERVFGSHPH